jgi:hypothetical protein
MHLIKIRSGVNKDEIGFYRETKTRKSHFKAIKSDNDFLTSYLKNIFMEN